MSSALSIEQLLHRVLLATGIGLVVVTLLVVALVLLHVWRSEAAARNKFGVSAR